ncbi:MAG: IclR family transcriptional regulator domain-containing protein, partial [Pseudomonadaceae bacterium]
ALLAALPDDSLAQLLPDPLPKVTPATPERAALMEQLARIRAGTLAEEHDELIEGMSSFAVVLDTYLGRYAIAVVAPSARAATRSATFQQALRACKQTVERAIGRATAQA